MWENQSSMPGLEINGWFLHGNLGQGLHVMQHGKWVKSLQP